jgi:hypothetical protein
VDGFVKDHVRETVSSEGRATRRLEVADIRLGAGVPQVSFREPRHEQMPAE